MTFNSNLHKIGKTTLPKFTNNLIRKYYFPSQKKAVYDVETRKLKIKVIKLNLNQKSAAPVSQH